MTGIQAHSMLGDPFDATLPENPYPGLRPFMNHEWPIFFGRETVTNDVMERVVRDHLVVVHGDSGCGKSSLVRAGVLVQLQQGYEADNGTWRTCAMLPREDPIGNLARALAALDGEEPSADRVLEIEEILYRGSGAPGLLAKMLRRGERDNICILVDQFEELFRFGKEQSPAEARIFTDFIVAIGKDRPEGLHAILTMRSEFLGACSRYRGLAETVNRTQMLLPRMGHRDIVRAIREPALLYQGNVSRALAERLIAEAADEGDALPLIQHGLMRLQHTRTLSDRAPEGEARSTSKWHLDLDNMPPGKDLRGLISDHADAVLSELVKKHPGIEKRVEHVFRALTDINADGNAIRRPQIFRDLRAASGASKEDLHAILDAFRADGVSFVTPFGTGPVGDNTLIDISHEAFIRCWTEIANPKTGWLHREFQDSLIWKSLNVSAASGETLSAAATTDREKWIAGLPSRDWAQRYADRPDVETEILWKPVDGMMDASRKAREQQLARDQELLELAEIKASKAELEASKAALEASKAEENARQRTRLLYLAAAASVIFAIVGGLAVYQWYKATAAQRLALDAETRTLSQLHTAQLAQSRFRASKASELATRKLYAKSLAVAVTAMPEANPAGWPEILEIAEVPKALSIALQGLRELSVLADHEGPINYATYSPDGTRIVTASDDKTARIWDPKTGAEISVLAGHERTLTSAAWSPDGTRIVTASVDKTARIWDAKTGDEISVLRGHEDWLRSAAYSPDGTRIVTASDDKTARIWDPKTGTEVSALTGHESPLTSAAYSPDGTRIVTASLDNTARIWNAKTGAEISVLAGHKDWLQSAAWSPDGTRIVTASDDKTARIWDAKTGAEIAVLARHEDWLRSAAWSPDGTRIVTASLDNTARIWDAKTGAEIAVLAGHERTLRSAAWSPDGTRIVTASGDKTARIWNAKTETEIAVLAGHEALLNSAAWSPDGTRIVTASDDRTARIWDAKTGAEIAVLAGHEDELNRADYSPDGTRIVTTSDDDTARIWDAKTGAEIAVLAGHKGALWSAAWSPDGTRIVTASDDKTARIWDATTGVEIAVLVGPENGLLSAAYSPDGTRIVTASNDKAARIWDAETGAEIALLAGHEGWLQGAAWSPDGTRIVTASDDKTARIWDVEAGAEIAVLAGHERAVNSAAWSADGTRIVTASNDKTARIWDAKTGAEIAVLAGHDNGILSATLAPGGTRIVTASGDNTARIWDAKTGAEISVLAGHEGTLYSAAYSPDGTRIVTASDDNTARIWRTFPSYDALYSAAAAIVERLKPLTPEQQCGLYLRTDGCER